MHVEKPCYTTQFWLRFLGSSSILLATFFRHPVEHEKGVDLRPKDIFEESLGIPGRRDQFSDRCGDGETNRGMMGQNTLSVHLESVILQTLNS